MKESISKKEYKKLLKIAAHHSWAIKDRGDLERRMNDGDDFLELSVWGIKAMLIEAYELGKSAKD